MADIYHANFKSQNPRPSRGPNIVTFGATSDAAAEAIAAELGNWTTGQPVSLSHRIGGSGFALPYPVGTRRTLKAQVNTATGRVWRTGFRNANTTLTEDDVVALFTGVVGTGPIGGGFLALAAPPAIPGSGGEVITGVASGTFVTKS